MKKFFTKYFDFSNPGSFSGVSGFKKNNPEFKTKEIKEYLSGTETYTYHKKTISKFKRAKFRADFIDHIWQVDLIDFRNLKNKKYKQWMGYVYVCIDVLSRYAWVEPIETKTTENCKIAIEKIIKKSNRKPQMIYSDRGKEFLGTYKKYLKSENIYQSFTNSKFKASIAERFIRTIKEKIFRAFTYKKQEKYIDIIQKLTDSYNNSIHRSIGIPPSEVNKDNEQEIYNFQYGEDDKVVEFKFEAGDYVRVKLDKTIFQKGYSQKWSSEIFLIDSKYATNPPTYTIKEIKDSSIDLKKYYYSEELQSVKSEEFPYDTFEIVDQKKDSIKIKKLNDANQEEVWIEKKTYNLRKR